MTAQEFHQGPKVNGKSEESLNETVRLPSSLAVRMAQLQDVATLNQTKLPWNCFGAVQFVAGNNTLPQLINHMPEFGQKMDIDQALSKFSPPFAFQIVGRYEIPGEFNMGTEEDFGVIHAGIVLGIDSGSSSINVFEKDAWGGALQTSPWHEIIQRFSSDIEYFRFFEIGDQQFQKWCKSWDQA